MSYKHRLRPRASSLIVEEILVEFFQPQRHKGTKLNGKFLYIFFRFGASCLCGNNVMLNAVSPEQPSAHKTLFFFWSSKMLTLRQRIIELLTDHEMDARELSREVGIQEKEVYAHLPHISRSLAAKGSKIMIRPSECLKCGFVFEDRRRFTRPGRCPRCRDTHIINPSYRIVESD
jgi:predicted Zn-ribbon and HTH transcriptional regulator